MSELTSAPIPVPRAGDHVRGREGARVVIVYSDFACPFCALAHERMRDLDVRIVYRHFTLKAKHERGPALAAAAEAAANQGAFWEMHDALFEDQGHQDDPHLWERAKRLGLDVDRFEADRRDPAVADRIAEDVRGAVRAGVMATPTVVVGSELFGGPPDPSWLHSLGL